MFSLPARLVFACQRDSFPSLNVQSYYPLQPSACPPNPIPLAAGFYFAPRILECRLPVGEYSKLANVGTSPEHCRCARYSSSCVLATCCRERKQKKSSAAEISSSMSSDKARVE